MHENDMIQRWIQQILKIEMKTNILNRIDS